MIRYKFSKNINVEFATALKNRVNAHFKDNDLSRKANASMIRKTFLATGIYFALYFIILFSGITSVPLMFGFWILLGAAQAFIGMAVMHDVLHGSFSNNKTTNALMQIPVIAIGVESSLWQLQHNVLHHTYTNIEHADEDIAPRYVLRMTENQPRRWFHRYQHYYVTFFYSLIVILWMTIKDFIKLRTYKKTGLITSNKEALGTLFQIIIRRSLFYGVFLVIPLYALNFSPLLIVLMFVTMLAVSGLILSIVFQAAHIVPDCVTLQQDDKLINENWHVHQLMTTSNYATDNKLMTYFFGSLNFQVEHHLFPNICHVHYPALSKIVKATAAEFNIPYNCQKTFSGAVKSHYKHLKELGRNDSVAVTSTFVYV